MSIVLPIAEPSDQADEAATGQRWAVLGDAAMVVAAMAGIESEPPGTQARNLPALLQDCSPWRRQLVKAGVADLVAVMEPGIAALLAVSERGADPAPAARALWHEFIAAREAIVDLLPNAT